MSDSKNGAAKNDQNNSATATGRESNGRFAAGNKGGPAKLSSSTSAGNNWDSDVATPSFKSTDATTAYGARRADGSLPATTFLATGSTTIGSTMN